MSKAKKPVKEAVPALVTRKLLLSGPNRQIFIIDDADRISDVNAIQCVSLPHPKHNKPCRYLHTNRDIWEVQRVYQPPSSWFIQYDVQEDGSFYVCTRIDPLFLILPLLEKGRKKTADHEGYFLQIDQLISKTDFPHVLLASNTKIPAASSSSSSEASSSPAQPLPLGHQLCDIRPGWNESVVRLNDDKVVAWLRSKVERMRHAFKQVRSLQHHYTYSERSETAEQESERLAKQREEKKKQEAEETKENTEGEMKKDGEGEQAAASNPTPVSHEPLSCGVKQSLVFLSEYVPSQIFALLCASYKLTPEEVFERKKAAKTDNSWETTRVSGDIDTSRPAGAPSLTSNEKRKATEKPMSTTAKKLATAAKGTKSLASFFAKK